MNDPNNLIDCPLPTFDDCSIDISSYNNIVLGNKEKNLKHQDLVAKNKLGRVGVFKANDDTDASKKATEEEKSKKATEEEKSKKATKEEKSKKATEEEKSKKDELEKRNAWRYMPSCDMDWMIISSYGDQFDPSIEVTYKEQQDSPSNRMMLVRKEMQAVFDVCSKDRRLFLKDVCPDFPGVQFSKEEHMERIKQIMLSSEKEGGKNCYNLNVSNHCIVVIWYTGHGEKDTGNWCFKDGVISFQDVFGLYMDHMRGKRLTIISDCSYSGNWIKQCAEKLDEIGIPACGHHARDQEILLRLFPSCKANEKATISCYAKEAVVINDEDNSIRYYYKTLTSGQTSLWGDFRGLCCSSESGPCDVSSKWCDRLMTMNQLFLTRGKDRGRPVWHYILVDEDKFEVYAAMFRNGATVPHINLVEYGKVLESGWGENPPEDIKEKIVNYYIEY